MTIVGSDNLFQQQLTVKYLLYSDLLTIDKHACSQSLVLTMRSSLRGRFLKEAGWIPQNGPTIRERFQCKASHRFSKLVRFQSNADSSLATRPAEARTAMARRFFASSLGSSPLQLTKREFAQLEERIYKAAGSVVDPILGRSLDSLQWLHRRLAVSSSPVETGRGDAAPGLRMLLKVPTLLHPGLSDLKRRVRDAADRELQNSSNEIGQMLSVDVEAIATRPVPYAARWMGGNEEQEVFLRDLGPGLANVSHIVAVYSCKVRSAPC